jgi:hypothetical protein
MVQALRGAQWTSANKSSLAMIFANPIYRGVKVFRRRRAAGRLAVGLVREDGNARQERDVATPRMSMTRPKASARREPRRRVR